ncbi:hypothetical protein P7C70_g7895, partial [Phenoliferia sp. Uapishka_3]
MVTPIALLAMRLKSTMDYAQFWSPLCSAWQAQLHLVQCAASQQCSGHQAPPVSNVQSSTHTSTYRCDQHGNINCSSCHGPTVNNIHTATQNSAIACAVHGQVGCTACANVVHNVSPPAYAGEAYRQNKGATYKHDEYSSMGVRNLQLYNVVLDASGLVNTRSPSVVEVIFEPGRGEAFSIANKIKFESREVERIYLRCGHNGEVLIGPFKTDRPVTFRNCELKLVVLRALLDVNYGHIGFIPVAHEASHVPASAPVTQNVNIVGFIPVVPAPVPVHNVNVASSAPYEEAMFTLEEDFKGELYHEEPQYYPAQDVCAREEGDPGVMTITTQVAWCRSRL